MLITDVLDDDGAGMLGTQNALAYVTSKWAVRGMAKAAATELGCYWIRGEPDPSRCCGNAAC